MGSSAERFGPTRRGGPVFRWLGEPLAIDLANTVMVVRAGESVDLLTSSEDLSDWLDRERGRLGDCGFAASHLEEVRELRDAVRELFAAAATKEAPGAQALRQVNAAAAHAPAAPQLEVSPGGELETSETIKARDPLARLLGALAHSAIEIVTGPERHRLHLCTAPSCGMFFLGARRWCCSACGNRARAARHYRRTRETVK